MDVCGATAVPVAEFKPWYPRPPDKNGKTQLIYRSCDSIACQVQTICDLGPLEHAATSHISDTPPLFHSLAPPDKTLANKMSDLTGDDTTYRATPMMDTRTQKPRTELSSANLFGPRQGEPKMGAPSTDPDQQPGWCWKRNPYAF